MISSIHKGDLKENIQTSYTLSKFNCHGVCNGGWQDRPKIAQPENEDVHCTYIQCFSFEFSCTGICLKFHHWDWDWDLAKTSGWEMEFGQNLGWELGFIPPFRTLHLVPKILRAMTSSVVTGIIGIQTTGINGIRDILAKNWWDTGYSDPP